MANIDSHVHQLGFQTNLFAEIDENEERSKQDQLITQYKLLHQIDPFRASRLIQARTQPYIHELAAETPEDHSKTLAKWSGLWHTNEEFEKLIMEEQKWYQRDLIAEREQFRQKWLQTQAKHQAYIEGLELALNETKLATKAQIERLEMTVEDYRSKEVLADIVEHDESANTSFIEKFLNNRPQFTGVRECNRYFDDLQVAVRALLSSIQNLHKKKELIKREADLVQRKFRKLSEENAAMSTYFEWIQEIAMAGSNLAQPRCYLNQEQKKRLETLFTERMYAQHLDLLSSCKLNERAAEDVCMSKVFSIVASNTNELAGSIGLLASSPEVIAAHGAKRFKLEISQLQGLYYMLKTPAVREYFAKLNKYRDEMKKFGKLFESNTGKAGQREGKSDVSEAAIINERFRKLSHRDMIIKNEVNNIVRHIQGLSQKQQSNLAAADTSNSLAYQFNELMADELEYIEAEAAAAAERDPEDIQSSFISTLKYT